VVKTILTSQASKTAFLEVTPLSRTRGGLRKDVFPGRAIAPPGMRVNGIVPNSAATLRSIDRVTSSVSRVSNRETAF
jgi:hypothetical protein